MDIESIYLIVAQIVLWASLLSLMLPPVEFFYEHPRFQKGYALLVKLISYYAALNIRKNGNNNNLKKG